MIKVYILLVVLSLCASFGYASFDCSVYGSLEKGALCGKDGYLIGYGEKYCRRFQRNEKLFDRLGKIWLECTAVCLQKKAASIVKATAGKPDRCGKIKSRAFESHVGCYVNCGFCGIVVANMGALKDTYDFGDLFSIEAWQQIIAVISKCTG